jgi:polyadenylate-binding protein
MHVSRVVAPMSMCSTEYTPHSIRVCRDAVTRRSLGYAYVNYLNAADGETHPILYLNYDLTIVRQANVRWTN